jgi:acetyl-CoA decarbonylase/synthase complex subunit gamma
MVPALATYLSMNFTGASTYTSLSGVKKEMRYAVPSQIAVGVLGLGLWIYSIFFA